MAPSCRPADRQILDRSDVLTPTHRQARDFDEKLANAKADGRAAGCTTVTRTVLRRCVSHRPARAGVCEVMTVDTYDTAGSGWTAAPNSA
jgi:hypothetical protein